MKIYTRTGDKGTTSLFGGERVAKSSSRVEAYGTIDELNSAIGMAIAEIRSLKLETRNSKLENELIKIQHDLFEIGAYLATPRNTTVEKGKKIRKELSSYLTRRVTKMENAIDNLTLQLIPMKSFILPGGSKTGSLLHFVRSVARRSERRVVALANQEEVDENVSVYMNRLSDLLFTMARFINHRENKTEMKWFKQ